MGESDKDKGNMLESKHTEVNLNTLENTGAQHGEIAGETSTVERVSGSNDIIGTVQS